MVSCLDGVSGQKRETYEEWLNREHPEQVEETNQPKQYGGYASTNVLNAEMNTVLEGREHIEYNDNNVNVLVSSFAEQYSNSAQEHSLNITSNGIAVKTVGINVAVDPSEYMTTEELKNSIGIHNHPLDNGWEAFGKADSFSKMDVLFSVRNHTGMEYLTSGTRKDAFVYTGSLSESEIADEYEAAFDRVVQRAMESGEIIEFWQEETMIELSKAVEGFEFYVNVGFGKRKK